MANAAELLLLCVLVAYALLSPYTKVEESFNTQAIHDLLYLYPARLGEFDHHEFPGVVPRTFLGAISVALAALPFQRVLSAFGASKYAVLLLVRAVMAVIGWCACVAYSRSVRLVFGHHVGNALLIITSLQFHLPFYLSRPLPNTFAVYLILFALSAWLRSQYTRCFFLFTLTIVVFRSEVALLFAPILLELLLSHRVAFTRTVIIGIVCTLFSLGLSVGVDSHLWGRWLWPEGDVLHFNTVLNKSHEWGTSPWHWYYTSALPRALLGAPLLALIGVYSDWWRVGTVLRPALVFVSVYSLLPHKELRFVFYAIPLFNTVAAVGLAYVYRNRSRRPLQYLFALCLLLASLLCTLLFLLAAVNNYPGGTALTRLHALEPASKNVSVHIDVFSAMTGVSRFGELNPNWKYSKDERPNLDLTPYTHLLREDGAVPVGFEMIDVVRGFGGIKLRPWPSFALKPLVHIFRRRA